MGRGNRKAQNKRRRERLKNCTRRYELEHELIDGNLSHYPIAFCRLHGAYLTQGLADTHRCIERQCVGYETMGGDAE